MTIEKKAREIAESVRSSSFLQCYEAVTAARLGIIEGLEMAHQHLALVYLTNEATACEVYLEGLQDAAAAILALIVEQKP